MKKNYVFLMMIIFLIILTILFFINFPKNNEGNNMINDSNLNLNKNDLNKEIYLGEKIELLNSGNSNEKVDLLFIPQGISDIAKLESKIKELFYNQEFSLGKGLFSTSPFDNYLNKFNIAYVDKNIDEDYFEFSFNDLSKDSTPQRLHFYFNAEKLKEEYTLFNPDYIIILFESDYTSGGGEIQQLNLASSNYVWQFVHEFGHQFGGLADEYVLTDSPSYRCGNYIENSDKLKEANKINLGNCFKDYVEGLEYYPNLDILGCPKWCEDYNLSAIIKENSRCSTYNNEEDCSNIKEGVCTWFETKHPFLNSNCVIIQSYENIGINCIENTQCIFGGDYGQLAFNAGATGIMNGGQEFTYPSKNHLEKILECCYPKKDTQECSDFREFYSDIPEEIGINPYFRIAYEKIANCS